MDLTNIFYFLKAEITLKLLPRYLALNTPTMERCLNNLGII